MEQQLTVKFSNCEEVKSTEVFLAYYWYGFCKEATFSLAGKSYDFFFVRKEFKLNIF